MRNEIKTESDRTGRNYTVPLGIIKEELKTPITALPVRLSYGFF